MQRRITRYRRRKTNCANFVKSVNLWHSLYVLPFCRTLCLAYFNLSTNECARIKRKIKTKRNISRCSRTWFCCHFEFFSQPIKWKMCLNGVLRRVICSLKTIFYLFLVFVIKYEIFCYRYDCHGWLYEPKKAAATVVSVLMSGQRIITIDRWRRVFRLKQTWVR